ncbi:response regulator [Anabaena cylindrica FACHB-243]|uniref:histidine kinase n=1 Tax=Anabaena cylindrica (strain ATCC 27899 / PCC 7122) TaxID=272123 RepID=K9ZB80_ANACC|nr:MULTISPECIES: response regulator [Anabaena]AFZ55989.1 CheA signal transduction histidine kinase [Anabaena cylindrica PCC 7122]MBD2419579.1 response regulator [Anabaena cylindrica FACHB-243]MBY5282838.1 response regulator [Anabaena sp. CCAP 1446/1C]MBY5306922.1 response regulator [Anabaena sp. CCAP 1446/1C]MCM2407976.1 response regulator [Anabaena sp. CCAP 1446/1C]
MQPEQQQRILGYFIEEAREHLNTIEQGLLKLQDTLNDPEMINEVFRAAHSIKGGAAMLGFNSIQQTSHRLEDCFKVLKEHPVAVDQKLESLFLGVSDTLKALLDHLGSPFGLSEETAHTLMLESEPIFAGLNQHLELLLQSADGASLLAESAPTTQPKQDYRPQPQPQKPPVSSKTDDELEFQTQVLQALRDMLQLFKQSSVSSSRNDLQKWCDKLVKLGERLNLLNWCSLCQAAGNAIANPENSYLTLAKIIITEIKQAQELVIQGREAEITISPQLEALELLPELELLELTLDWADEQSVAVTEFSETLELHTDNLWLEENSTIIFETTEELNLAADTSDNSFNNLPDIAEINTDATTVSADSLFSYQDSILNLNHIIDLTGPEVGISELNTLADLFAGETPELEETWQKGEMLDTTIHQLGISDNEIEDENDDLDLDYFLSLDTDKIDVQQPSSTNTPEDLTPLFGDNFLEVENLEQQHQTTTAQTRESSDNFLDDLNLELSTTDSINVELTVNSVEIESADINTHEAVENLSAVTDENELLSTEPESLVELEINPNLELSNITANSVDNLLPTANADSLEELTFDIPALEQNQPTPESLSLDNLFNELAEDTQEPIDDLGIGDIFDLPEETTAVEVATDEDDFNSFWNETDVVPTPEIAAVVEQDVARELEESLFAALSGDGEAVSDHQESETDLSFYLQDFDFTVQEKEVDNLNLTSDTVDNLFADLADSQFNFSIVDNGGISSLPEVHSFSQEPEALNFTPEFTNQSSQKSSELEDTLVSFDDDSNQDSSLELTGIDVPVTALPALTDQEELIINSENIDWVDSLSAEASDTVVDADSLELGLEADESAMELAVLAATDENIHTIEEKAEQLEVENTVIDTAENEASFLDELAELDALLEDEELDVSASAAIPDADFAALEELLGSNNFAIAQTAPAPPKVYQPAVAKAQNPVVSSELPDEFRDLEKLLAEADQTMSSQGRVIKSSTSKTPRPTTRRVREESMKIPVKQLDEMSNLVGELVVNRNTLEQDHERLRQSLDNLLIQVQHLSDVGARMQELYERSLLEASLLSSRNRSSRDNSSSSGNSQDRGFSELEMDHFTMFHTLSQETIEFIVRVRESASDIDFVTEETERVARQFRQVTTQLQEGLTRTRMIPFAQAIDRLRRGVRENGIKCGKQVDLVTEGADTLIDKMILDHLTDPLTHMLNNAIAHGIETPEVRKATGKPAMGIITICAFHQGNQTVISVTDDGAGIDHEKVKFKAIQKGVITPEDAQNMSRLDIYDLLFLPSFSTADEIDDLKGRGVGMDVVRTDISEIRGTVGTDSIIGKGTTFTIRLPLTLSICKALCCISDKSRIAFPMDGVEDTLDISATDIQQDSDGQSFIFWRDTVLPFRPLHEILAFNRQISRGNIYGNTRDDDLLSVVVLRSGNTMVALQIDQVLSEQEIVIKQFEGPAPKPSGVAGATVLGDGRIMPIADVLEIIDIFQGKMSKQIGGGSWQRKTASPVPETPDVKIEPTVLIVDDSITVRELLSLTFNKAGYRVEQARDGQEAWDKLRSGLPCDIVFCDIEMPRCDGLELLSRIQKDNTLNHLPIAMLTSRGADKHRQMAVQLGASGYFTKPYLEEALLEAASRMLKGEKLVTA